MQAHEHTMADAVASHEETLGLLIDASSGFQHATPQPACRHCGEPIVFEHVWQHAESCAERCDDGEADTRAEPSAELLAALDAHGVDVDDLQESADQAWNNYALSVETVRYVDVMLGIGGPTVYLRAQVVKGSYESWERSSDVELHDSWAVPSMTTVPEDSCLTALFDRFIETYAPED